MKKPPMQLNIVFHPKSDYARALARQVHRFLNEDSALPGLRIPTVFTPHHMWEPQPLPDLTEATRCFVVVLADAFLAVDNQWCDFVAEVYQACETAGQRFVPVQLSQYAYPLHPSLEALNFIRAWMEANPEAFTTRRIVIELCRLLQGEAPGNGTTGANTQLFLSHTKLDIGRQQNIFNMLVDHLSRDKPVAVWVDSADIHPGSKFEEAITNGVKNTSLLCVLTDNYASREWCRKEVLLAKKHQRPVVVIDGLDEREVRSFPYMGNVPVLRWANNPEAATDLVLKETLRVLHVPHVMEQWLNREKDDMFIRPPELVTLLGTQMKPVVLYPDPPLGQEETELLARTGIAITTPLERIIKERPLTGKRVAISVSESTDIESIGLDPLHLDNASMEMCRYLLLRGATLVYGGHLGAEGYTNQLSELVRTHNSLKNVPSVERIINYRGWPLPRLNAEARAKHLQTALIHETSRPAEITESLHADFTKEPSFFSSTTSPKHRFAWSRGMTEMRELQTSETCARLVMGGTFGPTLKVNEDGSVTESWYSGCMPGTLEEIVISVQAGQPVFLIGAFGGVAKLAVDIIEGRDRQEAKWDFQKEAPHSEELRTLYEEFGIEWVTYENIRGMLQEKGFAELNPLLTLEESTELAHTRDVARIVELVVTGVANAG